MRQAAANQPTDRHPKMLSGRIGRYAVLSRLGEGGMGVVYSAFDEGLGRRVAVKLLFATRAQDDAARRRLEREAQVLARLSHPNVVQVFEVGEHQGDVFMAMEYVEGVTLATWATARPRPWAQVLDCYLQAARGLKAAHDAGILHRDFKPDNVMLGDDGRVRVLDFGLARARPGESRAVGPGTVKRSSRLDLSSRLTATGHVHGTPAYSAPEQFLGRPTDARSDVFSFCVALYEALYCRRPHRGKTRYALLQAKAAGAEAPPAESRVPAWIERVVMQGLAPDPRDRPASMQAVIEALRRDPRRRRWRLLAGVGGAGLAALAALGGAMAAEEPRPCEGLERRLDGVWDATRREQARSAFVRSGSSLAEAVWPVVEGQLDRHASALADGLHEACAATRVTGEQSERRLDQRMACLDDRLRATRALTAQLTQADAQIIAHAEEAVAGLPRPEPCAESMVLDAMLPPPADVAQAERVTHVRERLADGRALIATGHAAGARPVLDQVRGEPDALRYEPLAVEVALFGAELDHRTGRYASSVAALHEVVDRAEASRHDQVLADAWLLLVYLGVDLLGDEANVDAWIRRAEAADRRVGGSAARQVALAGLRALLAVERGDARQAQEQIDRGLRLRQTTAAGLPYSNQGLDLDHARARLAVLQGRRDLAIRIWEHKLQRHRLAGPGQHPRIALAHFNLGNELDDAGQLDAAREHYQHALALWTSGYGGSSLGAGRALVSLADLARRRDQPAEAQAYLQQASAYFDEAAGVAHPDLAEALVELGLLAFDQGQLRTAVGYHERALAMYEQLYGDRRASVGLQAANLAEVVLYLGDLGRADALLSRGDGILVQTLGAQSSKRAFPLKLRGMLHLLEGQPSEAVAPLERALALCPDSWPLERGDIAVSLAVALWPTDPDRARTLAASPAATEHHTALIDLLSDHPEPLRELWPTQE